MQLPCLVDLIIVFCICELTAGISNDLVGDIRCKLVCKEANGYSPQLEDDGVCKCNILKTLTEKQLVNIQELSTYYNLPVLFRHDRHSNKVKREVNDNLLEDFRSKLDEQQQQWIEQADNLKAMWEQQRSKNMEPLLGSMLPIGEHAEKLREWHEKQMEQVGSVLEDKNEEWQDNLGKLKEEADDHLENLKSIHEDLVNGGFEEHLENLKSMQEDLLGNIPAKLEENKQKLKEQWKSWQDNQAELAEPILGQMAPSLTTYESHGTGVGGSNVNFPPPNHPNPFVPPLAHIISAFPFPRFNFGGSPLAAAAPAARPLPFAPIARPAPFAPFARSAPVAPAAQFTHPLVPQWNPIFKARNAAALLPEKFSGNYNPSNPIVVQPVIIPSQVDFTPKPILHSLQKSVDEMLANMKKHGGRLVPENFLNSDALSNSESQVNQINVNVRYEPTPAPSNLFSLFFPNNGRNWLSAPVPKNMPADGQAITEDPGMAQSDENDKDEDAKRNNASGNEEEEEDLDEEHQMQQQLKDASKSKSEPHVVDSVKKNLRSDKVDKDSDAAGEYNARGLIVQPKEFMEDSDEDLQTLAK